MARFTSLMLLALACAGTTAAAQENPLPEARRAQTVSSPASSTELGEPMQLAAAGPAMVPSPSGKGTPVSQITPEQRSAIEQANAYFNSIQSLSGKFVQVGPDGRRAEGQLFLKKPGKLRFEFAPPSKLQIIADGKSVAIRDRALATQDLYPLSQTPLRYLLQSNIDLLRDTKVTAVFTDPEMVSIAIEETSKVAGTTKLMLVFGGANYELKQWTVTDAQGLDTTVSIYDLQNTVPEDRLFSIDYTVDPAAQR
jgi:outer membrane lipoprotein-sorting protein